MNINNNKKIFLLLFNLIFWFLIFLLIIKIVRFKISLGLFYHISFSPLILSFIFYILFAWIRGVRFAYTLGSKDYLKSYGISGIYTLGCSVFPGGIGEAMLPIFIKKYLHLSFSKGTALLLTTRVFDILFVIIFFIISLFLSNLSLSNQNVLNLFGIFLIILFFSIVFIIFFYRRARVFIITIIKNLTNKRKFTLYSIIEKLINFLEKIDAELTHINSKKKGIITLLTLFSRISIFISFFFLFRSVDIHISIIHIIFISTLVTLMLIIPFQGIGGFGSYEIWVTMGLIIVGISKNQALPASIPIQLFTFIFSIIEGFFGYILLIISDK